MAFLALETSLSRFSVGSAHHVSRSGGAEGLDRLTRSAWLERPLHDCSGQRAGSICTDPTCSGESGTIPEAVSSPISDMTRWGVHSHLVGLNDSRPAKPGAAQPLRYEAERAVSGICGPR